MTNLNFSDNKLTGNLPFQFPFIKYCSILPGNTFKIDLTVVNIHKPLAPEIIKTIKSEFQARDLFREFLNGEMLEDTGKLVNIQGWFVDLKGNLMLRDECRDYLDGIIKKEEKAEVVEVKVVEKVSNTVSAADPELKSVEKEQSDSDEEHFNEAPTSPTSDTSMQPPSPGMKLDLDLEEDQEEKD